MIGWCDMCGDERPCECDEQLTYECDECDDEWSPMERPPSDTDNGLREELAKALAEVADNENRI